MIWPLSSTQALGFRTRGILIRGQQVLTWRAGMRALY